MVPEAQTQKLNCRDLPSELLNSIANRLPNPFDIQRFRAVCPEWHSSIPAPFNNKSLLTQITLPLRYYYGCVSGNFGDNVFVDLYSFYKLTPLTSQQDMLASSCIIKVVYTSPDGILRLMDPLAYRDYEPSLKTRSSLIVDMLDFDIDVLGTYCKVSNCPSCTKTVVSGHDNASMLGLDGYTRDLVYWRLVEDDQWSFDVKECDDYVMDVISYKEGFCAVEENGRAVFVGQDLELTEIASPLWDEFEIIEHRDFKSVYLIWSLSDLLLVAEYKHRDFKVYKLDEKVGCWIEVENLDGRILFLDKDCSFSLCAADFDACNGNKIFYEGFYPKDDFWYVYDMVNKCVQRSEVLNYKRMFKPPDSWIVPEDFPAELQSVNGEESSRLALD